MKKVLWTIICMLATAQAYAAPFSLTATKVSVQDLTVDKHNFFVTVEAETSNGAYEVAFDVWPTGHSAIGAFSSQDGSISYVNSYVHKTQANGSAVNMWYNCNEDAAISLIITKKDDATCTLTGSIEATRNNVTYTYNISAFDFPYAEDGSNPGTEEDPFRFEPATAGQIQFVADVVSFRQRDNYIEITLNEIANETYDWIELRFLSSAMALPAGIYTIDDSGNPGSLTASKGYLGGTKGDDPCYVAIRGDKDEWGQYTPYYLKNGSLSVSYNNAGDSITISGTVTSHNGSVIQVYAKSYNMLYVEPEQPKEPEHLTLGIDTVMVTYLSNLSDSTANRFVYTFNFSKADDYPTVLMDAILPQPMALVAGTYSMENGLLEGLQLAQNQADYEANLFTGSAYEWTAASLTLEQEDGLWRYTMTMEDAIGSSYTFTLLQEPHIIYYPQVINDKDKPYAAESQTISTQHFVLDTLVWQDATFARDSIIDIILTCKHADANGVRPYIHLGMYSASQKPDAGEYPVNDTEAYGTFSASLGQYGNVLIPCYAAVVNEYGYETDLWFLTGGNIRLAYV